MENINPNQLRLHWAFPAVTEIIKQVVVYEPDQGESEEDLAHGGMRELDT